MTRIAPYGSWKSPITADLVASSSVHFGTFLLDGEDLYWTEIRPHEGGRTAVVCRPRGQEPRDVLPLPFNARTRVHEYGGGELAVMDGVLYFSNFTDQRLYRKAPGAAPLAITPAADLRYADATFDRGRGRLYCVREDHRAQGEAVNTIVVMPLEGDAQGGRVVAEGHDFFAAPRLSPNGATLAWLSWDHPNMPWDDTHLWVAAVRSDGTLGAPTLVAGGRDESVIQPRWTAAGDLCFISDRTDFWNLYLFHPGNAAHIQALCPREAEVGGPAWVFGISHYDFTADGRTVFASTRNGNWRLSVLESGSKSARDIAPLYSSIRRVEVSGNAVYLLAGTATEHNCISRIDLGVPNARPEVLAASSAPMVDAGYISLPEDIKFPTADGQSAHGNYYPPCNGDFTAPEGALPPLLVLSHGGPTAQSPGSLAFEIQYWTSRGIAVLDVNYRGSTGYGRAYRNLLRGRWGIVDVDDCVNGARFLAARGQADGQRSMIEGGSAGGYTTLAALTFRSYFKAGASHYGIGDLTALARDTHKFESRYLDSLVGPYPAAEAVYRERSPAFFTERLSAPLIIFQGLEDKVVPPSQAVTMFEALRAKGIPVAYLPFAGEQHGFRQAANIKRAMEAELYFYSRVFGFPLADPVEPVEIRNM